MSLRNRTSFALCFALAVAALPGCADIDENEDFDEVPAESSQALKVKGTMTLGSKCQNVFDSCMVQGGCTLNPFTGGWGTCPSGVFENCTAKAVACEYPIQ